MTRTKSTYLALVAVLLSPMAANAVLIEGLCDATADSTVTCDTDTGLEWLDLTETLGLTANQFLADVGGWISQGWDLAFGTDVEVLFADAGFTDLNVASPALLAAAQLMLDLFGTTGVANAGPFGEGFAFESPTLVSGPFYQVAGTIGFANGSANCCFDYDFVNTRIGIWANRIGAVAVPEPGTLALLGLGLAGMGLARRRRKV